MASEIECPFCAATDFDLVGLKHHLLHHCEPFEYTPGVDEERREILAGLDARTKELEYCCECGQPTGPPGRHDDSLYVDDDGPYCAECYPEGGES